MKRVQIDITTESETINIASLIEQLTPHEIWCKVTDTPNSTSHSVGERGGRPTWVLDPRMVWDKKRNRINACKTLLKIGVTKKELMETTQRRGSLESAVKNSIAHGGNRKSSK